MLSIVQKIADNLQKSTQVKFELNEETIQQIGAIVMQIVAMFKECKKTPEQATVAANNPNMVEKRKMRVAIRRELGFFKNWREGDEYYDAVLKAGYTANVNDVQEAYLAR